MEAGKRAIRRKTTKFVIHDGEMFFQKQKKKARDGKTTFGKVGPLLAAKIGPGGHVLARTTFRMTDPLRREALTQRSSERSGEGLYRQHCTSGATQSAFRTCNRSGLSNYATVVWMAQTCAVCSKVLQETYRVRDRFGKPTQLGRVIENLLGEALWERGSSALD